MPEDHSPPPSQPRSSRPRLSELSRETTEDDLWDLDDEPAEAVGKGAAEAVTEDDAEEAVEESPEAPPQEAAPSEVPADPAPAPAPEPDDEVTPESSAPPAEPEPAPAEPEPAEPKPKPEESDAAPAARLTLPGRRDLINLAIVAAVFLGLAIWWMVSQFSDIPTTRIGGDEPSFPIKGDYAEVETAATYWRKPVRDGESRDVARPEVSHIPVVSVKLAGGTGALRAVFRTHTGDFVGDTITQSFENGKFVANKSDTIEFPATDGYETDGDMNGYRVGNDRWKIEILESPGAEASGSRFKSMFTIPVSPAQR